MGDKEHDINLPDSRSRNDTLFAMRQIFIVIILLYYLLYYFLFLYYKLYSILIFHIISSRVETPGRELDFLEALVDLSYFRKVDNVHSDDIYGRGRERNFVSSKRHGPEATRLIR